MVECIPTSVYFLISIRVRKVPPPLALRMGGSSGVFLRVAPEPDRTGPDRTGPDRTGPDRTGPDRTGPDRMEEKTKKKKYVWRWHKNGREGPTRI